MVFPVVGGTQDTGYTIDNSLRFNDDDSPILQRTASGGNRRTFTWSSWIKRANLFSSASKQLFTASDGTTQESIMFTNDSFRYIVYNGSSNITQVRTNALLRDPSAWYHLVVKVDYTQSTASNRVKLYINGTEQTSLAESTYANQNTDTYYNQSGNTVRINNDARSGVSEFFDGYYADMYFVDGTAVSPTEFGETNDNGVWIPKKYDGSYGTNGFKLEFKQSGTGTNSSGMGADTSGNTNHFAVTNLTATDVTVDTPTNNWCTLNPLDNNEVPNGGNHVYAEGNTKFTATAGNNDTSVQGTNCTMAVANGKWYWEAEIDVVGPNYPGAGILAAESHKLSSIQNGYAWNAAVSAYGYQYLADGQIGNNDNSTSSGWSAWNTAGKILMFALDMDNNKIYYGQNGTWDNSGDPTSGSTGTGAQSVNSSYSYLPHFHLRAYDGSASPGVFLVNFGNPPFAISSGNSDANGYGNFEYAVPSGYYALCTKNLAEYG